MIIFAKTMFQKCCFLSQCHKYNYIIGKEKERKEERKEKKYNHYELCFIRQLILTGCVAFAQHVGAQRVEAELLPQCWEQLAHKYPERRLLVAESCGTLAPYIPVSVV